MGSLAEYPVSIEVGTVFMFQFTIFRDWALENNIDIRLYSGRLYFKDPEHAVLFKLRFEL